MPGATLTVDGAGVARLWLDEPGTGNALSPTLIASLRERAEEAAAREDVRVLVLAGAGRAFCVGGDLRHFAGLAEPEAPVQALATELHAAVLALVTMEAPVIARVHGAAAGAGFSLVCAADLAVASPAASFTSAYTRIGLSPDGGQSWLLPRLVGHRRAVELMLTNRRLDAAEAQALGIVTDVVGEEGLDARVDALAAALADGPTPALGAAKRLLLDSATAGLADHLAAEAASIARLAASPGGREGVRAFVEKRAPEFRRAG